MPVRRRVALVLATAPLLLIVLFGVPGALAREAPVDGMADPVMEEPVDPVDPGDPVAPGDEPGALGLPGAVGAGAGADAAIRLDAQVASAEQAAAEPASEPPAPEPPSQPDQQQPEGNAMLLLAAEQARRRPGSIDPDSGMPARLQKDDEAWPGPAPAAPVSAAPAEPAAHDVPFEPVRAGAPVQLTVAQPASGGNGPQAAEAARVRDAEARFEQAALAYQAAVAGAPAAADHEAAARALADAYTAFETEAGPPADGTPLLARVSEQRVSALRAALAELDAAAAADRWSWLPGEQAADRARSSVDEPAADLAAHWAQQRMARVDAEAMAWHAEARRWELERNSVLSDLRPGGPDPDLNRALLRADVRIAEANRAAAAIRVADISEAIVVPVLLVPADWDAAGAEVQADAQAVEQATGRVQEGFYAGHLDGATFARTRLQVVQSSRTTADLGITPSGDHPWPDIDSDTLVPAVHEEIAAIQASLPVGESPVVISVFVKGADAYNWTYYQGSVGLGVSIIGGDTIDALQRKLPPGTDQEYWERRLMHGNYLGTSRQSGFGVFAHETGHALGLSHPENYGSRTEQSIMSPANWGFPWAGLTRHEIDQLRSATGPGRGTLGSIGLHDELTLNPPAPTAEDMITVPVVAPEGTRLKVNGQDVDGPLLRFIAAERREVSLEVDTRREGGRAFRPAELEGLAPLGFWVRNSRGVLRYLGSDDQASTPAKADWKVEAGATLIYAPVKGTPVSVRFQRHLSDQTAPLLVRVEDDVFNTDGSGTATASIEMGRKVELRARSTRNRPATVVDWVSVDANGNQRYLGTGTSVWWYVEDAKILMLDPGTWTE